MGFQYKHALVVGATSGIGLALTERLLHDGVSVTAVGRRKDRLDEIVRKYGERNTSAVRMDISKLDNIAQFAESVITAHPDLDCIFLNAGIQSKINLADSTQFDLEEFQQQILVNFTSIVALTHAFLPFLQGKNSPTSIVFTGSNFAFIPAAPLPAYSCSKAALNAFVLSLREQLQDSTVKVVEVSPPAVQTELHDYLGAEMGREIGMPLDEYVDITYKRLVAGEDQIIVGSIGPPEIFHDIIRHRRMLSTNLAQMMRYQIVAGQDTD
ncbi:oxidoreductase, short-chain dehydrogenase/reductase family [Talaromyces stipitatus ATCC 10500]|uniref:Oxidoreductase, short-chain dehydrogenase/reductase family n=1 Tax=Talaromyces stipitatus (strain ATCC 10500 / CBS 375.48 / QM 6759 / NRRL 1006) TaxID=441959 RepID=B8LUA0_TALSN|nr:oxidoreductase, short-chain dehydrogenase/reductase family [Talaromyces stipitatus ATCC 10500]EED22572.1 oxidoreductase, short-chain dehydrogenase/reductase family [Talaromyces stipitatus ATCC 10500]